MAMPGMAFRTPTSVALVVSAKYGVPPERLLLEYAPEGKFAEEGPLAAAGARLLDACVLEPVRSRDWFARFSELWRERDRPQISPELAAAFAEKTGLSQTEAAVVLQGRSRPRRTSWVRTTPSGWSTSVRGGTRRRAR
ncbi:hypothetical protein ACFQY7_50260 [Actinomadura luteofluorescens]|uniref:hypothetical protein n=1 Tax=Actinomadura luteofluorescens TaxID=46163 RepID=UPI00363C6593